MGVAVFVLCCVFFTVLEISLEFLLGLASFVLLAVFRALAKLRDWVSQIARLVFWSFSFLFRFDRSFC